MRDSAAIERGVDGLHHRHAVRGVHFLREAASAEEIGYKALAVNLSDVAAMGARPVATMLSIAVPPDCGKDWAFGFVDGFRNLSRQYDVALIGGDTVGSSHGITINVVAIGKIDNRCIKRRRDAKAGDVIVVNDFLGDSAAGLADVLGGRYHTPEARIHHHPVPQIDEGIWLGGRTEVHAMMDISDGLFSDLPHILELSHTGACVQIDRIPTRRTIEQAVCGGEDYKLLFTADADRFESLAADYKVRFGSELHPVGRITSETGKAALDERRKRNRTRFYSFQALLTIRPERAGSAISGKSSLHRTTKADIAMSAFIAIRTIRL
ncbi:MAG: thiamine-phosphate kinase [Alistipes putredinis]|nr:MAG: thiamine-phosphate kinase [Alistipes putredinis]